MPSRSAPLSAAVGSLVLACSSPSTNASDGAPYECPISFVGDREALIEVEPGIAVDGRFVPLHDGDALPLVTPPQGGHVSFVGVRAKNIDPCSALVRGLLRSPRTNIATAPDQRSVRLDTLDGDGWAHGDLGDNTDFANIPACPDYGGDSIVDLEFSLEVKVEDQTGRSTTVTRAVVPRCQQASDYERALCRCECSAGYTLGRCADPVDGGWLDGGADGS